jgi:predicted kinase
VLRSDELRGPAEGPAPGLREGRYDDRAVDAVYATMLDQARHLLERGHSVVLDATWGRAARRRDAARVAEETCSDLVELRCSVPPELSVRRVVRRAIVGGDASEATREVAVALADAFEPWPSATTVVTSGPPGEAVEQACVAFGPA